MRYVYLRDEVGVSEGRDMLDRELPFALLYTRIKMPE